jgi:stage II sporulation protein GA (sporulation sigma-E factor processing peptidase)
MDVVLILAVGLNFCVELLLLAAANRLCGYPVRLKRGLIAAALGGLYSAVCLVGSTSFLQSMVCRMLVWLAMGLISYGLHKGALRRCVVFMILSMALGGLSVMSTKDGFSAILPTAAILWGVCSLVLGGRLRQREYVAVKLGFGEKRMRLRALVDTGNTLRDPISGEQVLICGADVGEELTGIPQSLFADPTQLGLSGKLPGMRLLSYRTVGLQGSVLPAVRLRGCRVDGVVADPLVAFAPEIIGSGEYRMLTGGITA